MNKNKNIKFIVCEVVYDEIKDRIPEKWTVVNFEKSLHERSDNLREKLQQEINNSQNFDIVVLGYGHCGRGTEGLISSKPTLIIPRCEDCISMFLGSDEERRKQLSVEPGTYFLTRGYIGETDNFKGVMISGFSKLIEKYDIKTLEWVAKEMLKNYKRLAFINTGNYDITKWKEIAKKEADKYGLRFEEIKGSNKLLSKIINCNWDEQFIIVKPGVKITPEMFGSL